MESAVEPITDKPSDYLRNPYPYFADKRRGGGVFRGTVMHYSKTLKSPVPEHEYAAMSFDAVNKVFRDARLFNSAFYDASIGLFIGPSIQAMEGKKHREHRNLVLAAFKSKSVARWKPEIVRPVCTALVDEFVEAGRADLVRDFTLEFPTRVIAELHELVRQLRGQAGARRVPGEPKVGFAQLYGAPGTAGATILTT
jgi:cytochrome P450